MRNTNEQPSFEETAKTAEQKLERVSGVMDGAMNGLPKEEYKNLIEKSVDQKVSELFDILEDFITNNKSLEDIGGDMKDDLSPLFTDFVHGTEKVFIQRLFLDERWRKFCKDRFSIFSEFTFFLILSLVGKKYAVAEWRRHGENTTDSDSFEPLSLKFSDTDFFEPPPDFGALLPANVSITMTGDVGVRCGFTMEGGMLSVLGNTGNGVGSRMEGGYLIVKGNVGKYACINMRGGIVDLKNEVISFDRTAFSGVNFGTIIWRGTTLWKGGKWTEAGEKMQEEDRIPLS